MKPDSNNVDPPEPSRSLSLGRVLNQAEEIKERVAEAAGNLTVVNKILQQEKKASPPVQTLEAAIVQNEAAESQVTKAADDLVLVNAELAKEVTERTIIEAELADIKTDLAEAREDLSQSRANEEETRQRAFQDALTGLPNRVIFEQGLEQGLSQAKRHGWRLAVLFIDINKFKDMNDGYGHDLGDQVLRMVAHRLQASVRAEDTVSRWGGDEFACLLLDVKREADVIRLAEKMVQRIGETCAFGETALSIRVSIGVAIYPADGETADLLFKHADQAMYHAKRTDTGVRRTI